MKLHEIKDTPEETYASKWLKAHRVCCFKINADGSVSIDSSYPVTLRGIEEKCLPFKLLAANGDIDLASSKLETLQGLPQQCRSLNISACKGITNFDGVPGFIEDTLAMGGSSITSFVGISDHIKELRRLTCRWADIKEGGLGLVLIKNLHSLTDLKGAAAAPFRIIWRYLEQPDKIFECQEELIHNGFEEYAKL